MAGTYLFVSFRYTHHITIHDAKIYIYRVIKTQKKETYKNYRTISRKYSLLTTNHVQHIIPLTA